MKDFLGRELAVGDEVVYLQQYRTSSALIKAIVIDFTPCQVNLRRYLDNGEPTYSVRKSPHKIVKVNWSGVSV